MSLVVASCLLTVFAIFWATKRKKEYFLLCALAASLIVYLVFTLMYIAKKGGIGGTLRTILFLTDGFRVRLQYTRLTLWQLGYGLAVGRYLFPWLFVVTALYYFSHPKLGWLRRHAWVTAIPPGLALVLYYPPVFLFVARDSAVQKWLIYLSLGWIAAYLALGTVLLVAEPGNVRIRYIRTSAVLRCVMLLSVTALYALYCPQDPAQVYLFYQDAYMAHRGLWYLNPYLSPATYGVVLAANTVSLLLGSVSMMSVARMKWSEGQDDVRLQRKYDAASLGGSVFVHGIKNQLLANRVLCKRLAEQLDADQPDLAALRSYAQQLLENNAGLISHVEELYKSFKSNALSMRRCSLTVIVQGAVEGLQKKYPAARVETQLPEGLYVLADEAHLRAAITNLLVNGWEATVSAGKTEPIAVTCYEKQRVNGICVRDHGVGIGKYDLGKIFDPFYSSKNSNSNWGLGLYYVRTIVKKHMGTLKVESIYGSGASFYILLPKILPERGQKRGKVHEHPHQRGGGQ